MVVANNREERNLKRDQDMAKVKNHIGHQNEDFAPLSIQEQLFIVNAQVTIVEDTSLSTDKLEMIHFLNEQDGLGFSPLATQII